MQRSGGASDSSFQTHEHNAKAKRSVRTNSSVKAPQRRILLLSYLKVTRKYLKANLQVNPETENRTTLKTTQIIPKIMRTNTPSPPNPPFSFAFRFGGGWGTLLWILIRCRPAGRLPARHTAHIFRCPSVPIFCLF